MIGTGYLLGCEKGVDVEEQNKEEAIGESVGAQDSSNEQEPLSDEPITQPVDPNKGAVRGFIIVLIVILVLGLFAVIMTVGGAKSSNPDVLGSEPSEQVNQESVYKVDKAAFHIQQTIDYYIDNTEELDWDEKVYLDFDEKYAEYQDRIRKELSSRAKYEPLGYYDIKVGDDKVGELEVYASTTINVRGTVDHYTIEIFDTRNGGDYKDYDNRLVYDSVKDKK